MKVKTEYLGGLTLFNAYLRKYKLTSEDGNSIFKEVKTPRNKLGYPKEKGIKVAFYHDNGKLFDSAEECFEDLKSKDEITKT